MTSSIWAFTTSWPAASRSRFAHAEDRRQAVCVNAPSSVGILGSLAVAPAAPEWPRSRTSPAPRLSAAISPVLRLGHAPGPASIMRRPNLGASATVEVCKRRHDEINGTSILSPYCDDVLGQFIVALCAEVFIFSSCANFHIRFVFISEINFQAIIPRTIFDLFDRGASGRVCFLKLAAQLIEELA